MDETTCHSKLAELSQKQCFLTELSHSHEFVIIMHETDHVHTKWAQLAPLSIQYQASGTEELAVPLARYQDLTPNTHVPLQRAAEGRQCFSHIIC